MIVGRRSFSFGSQYLSENVTSDSDTWPSESHALIISTSLRREIFCYENSPLVLKLPCSPLKIGNRRTCSAQD